MIERHRTLFEVKYWILFSSKVNIRSLRRETEREDVCFVFFSEPKKGAVGLWSYPNKQHVCVT